MDITTLYNVDYIVDYKDFEQNNDISGNNNDTVVSDTRYRENILNVFYLTISEYDNLIERIDDIYGYINNNLHIFNDMQLKKFNEILVNAASTFFTNDKNYGILVLFSYEHFDKMHIFLKQFIIDKTINDEILDELKKNICV